MRNDALDRRFVPRIRCLALQLLKPPLTEQEDDAIRVEIDGVGEEAEADELRRLRGENARLNLENDIVKKLR